jgi:hypothetical protein
VRVLKHLFQQPFIAATGAAALVHSTWALGTLFAGAQPEGIWHLVGWLIPALLIAFALDVGQIATSAEIRQHGLTLARGVTFIVFAGATYYLQWLYIAHHMPAMAIAAGVSDIARPAAISMRDAALWVIPALLPLSTLLYTFSSGEREREQIGVALETLPVVEVQPVEATGNRYQSEAPAPALPPAPVQQPFAELTQGEHTVKCEACGWTKSYDNPDSAVRGLATHQARHCTALHIPLFSNGHSEEQS